MGYVFQQRGVTAVLHFFKKNQLPPEWKSMFIALIPKVKSPNSAKDFKPISLCNVYYKVVSKVLVNRLKCVLSFIVSQEQSVFISDRVIMGDCVACPRSTTFYGKQKWGKETYGLDMERAYNQMWWDYLREVMMKFGFAKKVVELIMGCIRQPSFGVLVNRTPVSWFQSTRGLRQGGSFVSLFAVSYTHLTLPTKRIV